MSSVFQDSFHMRPQLVYKGLGLQYSLLKNTLNDFIWTYIIIIRICRIHYIINYINQISLVHSQLCPTLCNPTDRSMPGLPVHHQLKFMSIESVIPSNHLTLCPLLLLLPSIFLSIRVFSNESVLRIRWPKYWSFSFSISPSNEHSGLISFRMDWFYLALDEWSRYRDYLGHEDLFCTVLCILAISS